jgi:hypothetical protein
MKAHQLKAGDSVLLRPNDLKWDKSIGLAVIIRLDNPDCILVRYTENLRDPTKDEKSVEVWTTWRRFAGIQEPETLSIARE